MDVNPVNYILVVPMIYLCAIFQKNLLPHVVCLSNIRQNLKKICVPVAFNRGQLVKRLHPVLSLHVLLRYQLSLGGVSLSSYLPGGPLRKVTSRCECLQLGDVCLYFGQTEMQSSLFISLCFF